jgi:biotin-dependent carboxylase-like uncharacterized protein
MSTFQVLTPGSCTTVQDKGRYGYQEIGVPLSGALDLFACRIANLLLGNPEECAILEITVIGPRFSVLQEADVALTGAEMGATINDKPVETWTTFRVKRGDVLTIGQIKNGCRAYMAVTGGIEVPVVMGSRSTHIGGKLGGYHGRPLKKGDVLKNVQGILLNKHRRLSSLYRPNYQSEIVLRVIPGPQDFYFREGLETFFKSAFSVSARADRMGYRLNGPKIKFLENMSESIISEPIMPGSVQIPADGQPIILLVEQTVGGYAKIATVISTDLPKLAQAIPGNTIRFKPITIEESHRLYLDNEKLIKEISSAWRN